MRLVGHREVALVHLADAPAGNGAAKTGLIRHQLLFAIGLARGSHGFGRDVLGALELVVAVVAGRQCTHFVDDVHQHLRAIGRQALTGDGVVSEDFFLFSNRLHEGFGVLDIAHALGAAHRDRLEVLAAHDGAHTRSARRTVQVVHDAGIQHAVFTGLADAGDARQRVLQALLEHLFGLPDALAPQVGRVAQFRHIVVDIEVHRFGTLALENHHVPARHLELGTPVAARVGAGNGARQRALGNHRVAPASGGHGAGQRAG